MRRQIITLTPLIDVVFILLVFFMLASSFLDWRSIDLSVTKSGGGSDMKGALLIDVRTDGLRLSGRPVDAHELKRELRSRFVADPRQRILVNPEPGTPLQASVDLIDRIAAAGGADISFVSKAVSP